MYEKCKECRWNHILCETSKNVECISFEKAPTSDKSGLAPGYMADLAKDISFLEEMRETLQKASTDKASFEHLERMINDWLNEMHHADQS